MEREFGLTPIEIVFLVVAILVTIPMVVFIKWIFKELKKEQNKDR